MAIQFTAAQQKVLDAQNHNILVSAAAGSGKTAVLVERIVRLISEGDHPLDIDRLLVVTFTRAAAAQMRERIGQALSARLRRDPGNAHLRRQEVLLHKAQITTMDSFFTFILRNYFSDIALDPGFRQIDQNESGLIQADVLKDFLEEKYASGDPSFLSCVDYFCTGSDDKELEELILELFRHSGSHPSPSAWLRERAADYDIKDEEELFETPWMRSMVMNTAIALYESDRTYAVIEELCRQPDIPDIIQLFIQEERERLFGKIRPLLRNFFTDRSHSGNKSAKGGGGQADLAAETGQLIRLWEEIQKSISGDFKRYPTIRGKKYEHLDPAARIFVKNLRDGEKERITRLRQKTAGQDTERILAGMKAASAPVAALSALTLEFSERFLEEKKARHLIDFIDLEHFALEILAERQEDGTYVPRRAARALRGHYDQILIDEYQDSNEVQELLLQIISGEDDGNNNRFMVGDIKQSIYRFRLARPEIFMEKYDSYLPDDPLTEKIELDQNFRSRKEVLDCVNALFFRLMRREIGGVEYSEAVSLKRGAVFPDEDPDEDIVEAVDEDIDEDIDENPDVSLDEDIDGDADEDGPGRGDEAVKIGSGEIPRDPYRAEFLLLDTGPGDGDDGPGEDGEDPSFSGDDPAGFGSEESQQERIPDLSEGIQSLTDVQKEALLIAGQIRRITGSLKVRDEDTGELRPARYGDIVILMRSAARWNEEFKEVLAREGIPAYAESGTGYFAAQEIRTVIEFLRTLDNPGQDIPLYGVLRGFFGGFTQDEIARIRLMKPDGLLYDSLLCAAGESVGDRQESDSDELSEKCRDFLSFHRTWRDRVRYSSVSALVTGILEETGYQDYCTALPAGAQRCANLSLLKSHADHFTKTDFTGLFQFLRYIDGLIREDIDFGEANTLDENADVVRIMTIHKSKGLEFPVCIVAGLCRRFPFRRNESSGLMLFDGDWGVGIKSYDPDSRVRTTTLRREEIADKICRDSMGEELRVLYVALTRAKEKLIMVGSQKGLYKKLENWEKSMAGFRMQEDESALPVSMIAGASCFAELIFRAAAAGDTCRDEQAQTLDFPAVVKLLNEKDLVISAVQEQRGLAECEKILQGLEGRPLDAQPEPEAAHAAASRFFRIYPHEELRDLYAQTSVSELKHRAMEKALGMVENGGGEGENELFPMRTPVPYVPAFVRREDEETESPAISDDLTEAGIESVAAGNEKTEKTEKTEKAGTAKAGETDGARRGTAFHRILELMDYADRAKLISEGSEALREWISKRVKEGRISADDAALVNTSGVLDFLRSSLAGRMEAADKSGLLYREQPFVMGVPADRIDPAFPADEMITVQGIIDAFFIEKDQIILVDYKTDRVQNAGELVMRYKTQLNLYAEALERAYGLPVAEQILYSTALRKQIVLE